MTLPDAPHPQRWLARALIWMLIVGCAAGTALFWSGQRRARTVDATVRLALEAQLAADGTLRVTEEVVVQSLSAAAVQRVLVTPGGVRWAGVTDAAGEPLAHTTLDVAEGVQVTVPLADAPSVLRMRYDLLGIATPGMDAAELSWPITDDRSPLAVSGMELDLTWLGEEEAQVIDVEAPGAAASVVSVPGGLRVEAGELPAHHLVEVHAAVPLAAVEEAVAEPRSVLAEMATPADAPRAARGGPAWPPVLVALAFVLAWAVVHRSHGREPDPEPTGDVTAPPGTQSPAEVGWLLRRGVVRKVDMAATVVDLSERGVLVIDLGTWILRPGDPAGLRPHEQIVVDWAFGSGPVLEVAQRVGDVRTRPSLWRDVRQRFVASVEGEGRSSGFVERTVDAESILGGGIAAASTVVAGVIGTALGQPAWLLCVAVGALAIVGVDSFARRSVEGATLAARWLAFGSHLLHEPDAINGHRGYALALGSPAAVSPMTAAVVDAVTSFEEAYLTSTSYLAGPRRLPWPRRPQVPVATTPPPVAEGSGGQRPAVEEDVQAEQDRRDHDQLDDGLDGADQQSQAHQDHQQADR